MQRQRDVDHFHPWMDFLMGRRRRIFVYEVDPLAEGAELAPADVFLSSFLILFVFQSSWDHQPPPSRATPQCRVLIHFLIHFLIFSFWCWDIDRPDPKKYSLIWTPNMALFVSLIFHCWIGISIFCRSWFYMFGLDLWIRLLDIFLFNIFSSDQINTYIPHFTSLAGPKAQISTNSH